MWLLLQIEWPGKALARTWYLSREKEIREISVEEVQAEGQVCVCVQGWNVYLVQLRSGTKTILIKYGKRGGQQKEIFWKRAKRIII